MNAADFYHQAFQGLPEGEFSAFYSLLGSDDPRTAELIALGGASLDLLGKAVVCDECHWGDEAAFGTPTDDFSGGRRLAILAMLRAERAFRSGDDEAGLVDLIAVMALGRHIGRGKYISGLAGFPIEDLAVTRAFEILGRLDHETRLAFAQRLESLPAFPELSAAIRAEQVYFRKAYREKFASLDEADVAGPIREAFGLPELSEENEGMLDWLYPAGDPAERMLAASGETRAGLLRLADEALEGLERMAQVAEGAEVAFNERITALNEVAESNPLLADLLRSLQTMRPIWEQSASRVARLRRLAARGASDNSPETPAFSPN
jgi:hypothetical protein